jgi:hypothetical protein
MNGWEVKFNVSEVWKYLQCGHTPKRYTQALTRVTLQRRASGSLLCFSIIMWFLNNFNSVSFVVNGRKIIYYIRLEIYIYIYIWRRICWTVLFHFSLSQLLVLFWKYEVTGIKQIDENILNDITGLLRSNSMSHKSVSLRLTAEWYSYWGF